MVVLRVIISIFYMLLSVSALILLLALIIVLLDGVHSRFYLNPQFLALAIRALGPVFLLYFYLTVKR